MNDTRQPGCCKLAWPPLLLTTRLLAFPTQDAARWGRGKGRVTGRQQHGSNPNVAPSSMGSKMAVPPPARLLLPGRW